MHESPVARELVEAAVKNAGDARRVTLLEIRLGPEGGYLPDALKLHIGAAAVGTVVEGADIEISQTLSGGPELVSINVEETA